MIASVDLTPGVVQVDHSDKDLAVSCTRPGWQPATGTLAARYQKESVGRLLSAGVAGVVEDAASSSDFSYDPQGLTVTLQPN